MKNVTLLNFDTLESHVKARFQLDSFIVFEDVDCMERKIEAKEDDKRPKKIDMSGLLNAIDGLIEGDGRILIMTTNHPEKIDPALRRPGRIDIDLKMDYATKDDVENILKLMYELDNVVIDFNLNDLSHAKLVGLCRKYSYSEVLEILKRMNIKFLFFRNLAIVILLLIGKE
ncbi:hypothetical protein GEMRC1_005937 [Eukaryota sp. GEM-RC1]